MKKINSFGRNKPLGFQMPGRAPFGRAYLSGYYPSGCDDIPEHVCDPCAVTEFGRIRGAAFIKNTFTFNDPSNTIEWQNGIASGDIKIIPSTNGEMADPKENMTEGFGDTLETLINYEFNVMFVDPNLVANVPFYNGIAGQRTYTLAFVTGNSALNGESSTVWMTPVTVTIVPKFGIKNDLKARVDWNVSLKWISNQMPLPHSIPANIFGQCFEL